MRTLPIETGQFQKLAQTLGRLEFFSNLTVGQLDLVLKFVRLYSFDPGEYVFRQGDPGDALFIVEEGVLSVKTRRFFFFRRVMGLLHPGTVFGEMALLDRKARSASVQAMVPARVFAVLASDFDEIVETNLAFAKKMRRVASQRLFDNRRAA